MSVLATAILSTLITALVSYLCLRRKFRLIAGSHNNRVYDTVYTPSKMKEDGDQIFQFSANMSYAQVQTCLMDKCFASEPNSSAGVYDSVAV